MEPLRERHAVVLVVDPLLRDRMADAEHRSTERLSTQATRIDDGTDVGDCSVFEDHELAGLDIDLDFSEPGDIRARLPIARVVVARGCHEPLARQIAHRRLRPRIDVFRCLVSIELPAKLDRLLRRLRQRHRVAIA